MEILDEIHALTKLPKDNIPKLFFGKVNVGKSSLINAVTKPRGQTSKSPGRTRSLIFFQLELEKKLRLVDFPGYGYSKIPN